MPRKAAEYRQLCVKLSPETLRQSEEYAQKIGLISSVEGLRHAMQDEVARLQREKPGIPQKDADLFTVMTTFRLRKQDREHLSYIQEAFGFASVAETVRHVIRKAYQRAVMGKK